jgi:HSP20 family protein
MPEIENKVPVKAEETAASSQARRPLERIRREIGSLYEDFIGGRPPSRPSFLNIGASRRARAAFGSIPAVHFTETVRTYEITSELPGGMDEKDVQVTFANGVLTIKGEKREEREEKKTPSSAFAIIAKGLGR